MSFIIAADEIKKTLPGYSPAASESFHTQSAKLADIAYEQAMKSRPEQVVVLMCGGTASGKSEYISVYLEQKPYIVFDGTLPSFEGARIKIRKAQKAGKKVEIHAVMPEDFTIAYIAFLNRERKFSEEHFFRTHSQSRQTLLALAKEFVDLPIRVVFSEYAMSDTTTLRFTNIVFSDRARMIEFLELTAYTESYIRKKVLGT